MAARRRRRGSGSQGGGRKFKPGWRGGREVGARRGWRCGRVRVRFRVVVIELGQCRHGGCGRGIVLVRGKVVGRWRAIECGAVRGSLIQAVRQARVVRVLSIVNHPRVMAAGNWVRRASNEMEIKTVVVRLMDGIPRDNKNRALTMRLTPLSVHVPGIFIFV